MSTLVIRIKTSGGSKSILIRVQINVITALSMWISIKTDVTQDNNSNNSHTTITMFITTQTQVLIISTALTSSRSMTITTQTTTTTTKINLVIITRMLILTLKVAILTVITLTHIITALKGLGRLTNNMSIINIGMTLYTRTMDSKIIMVASTWEVVRLI